MALTVDIADAVAAELAAGSFSTPFTPERCYLPAFELADLAEVKVSVVPKAVEVTGATRSVSQYDVQVDIGIQKHLSQDLDIEVGQLCSLVDEIAEHLRKRPLSKAPYAVWVRTANDPIYAPEHLLEKRVFTSVLTLTYRAMR